MIFLGRLIIQAFVPGDTFHVLLVACVRCAGVCVCVYVSVLFACFENSYVFMQGLRRAPCRPQWADEQALCRQVIGYSYAVPPTTPFHEATTNRC